MEKFQKNHSLCSYQSLGGEGESFQMKHAKFGEGGKEGSFVSPFYLRCRDSPPRMA